MQSRFAGSSRSFSHIVAIIMLQYFFDLFAPLQRVAFLIFEVVCSVWLDADMYKTRVVNNCKLHNDG